MALKGNAGFRWTDPAGNTQEHPLQWPLTLDSSARMQTRAWTAFGRDYSAQAAVSTNATAWEYRTTARFDSKPAELLDLLEDGADGVQVDYYPDLSQGDFYPCWLIEAGSMTEIEWEEERGTNEYRIPITLRTKSGTFADILRGTAHN